MIKKKILKDYKKSNSTKDKILEWSEAEYKVEFMMADPYNKFNFYNEHEISEINMLESIKLSELLKLYFTLPTPASEGEQRKAVIMPTFHYYDMKGKEREKREYGIIHFVSVKNKDGKFEWRTYQKVTVIIDSNQQNEKILHTKL